LAATAGLVRGVAVALRLLAILLLLLLLLWLAGLFKNASNTTTSERLGAHGAQQAAPETQTCVSEEISANWEQRVQKHIRLFETRKSPSPGVLDTRPAVSRGSLRVRPLPYS
jgi:hypothetical protein